WLGPSRRASPLRDSAGVSPDFAGVHATEFDAVNATRAPGRTSPRSGDAAPSRRTEHPVMSASTNAEEPVWKARRQRLAILLAMAMFVLVVDTSLMNVSISKVVEDLDTTVSGVQSAIALEALVSAAFILVGSKVGDLIGRKRAFVLGLLGYAIGAIS